MTRLDAPGSPPQQADCSNAAMCMQQLGRLVTARGRQDTASYEQAIRWFEQAQAQLLDTRGPAPACGGPHAKRHVASLQRELAGVKVALGSLLREDPGSCPREGGRVVR